MPVRYSLETESNPSLSQWLEPPHEVVPLTSVYHECTGASEIRLRYREYNPSLSHWIELSRGDVSDISVYQKTVCASEIHSRH